MFAVTMHYMKNNQEQNEKHLSYHYILDVVNQSLYQLSNFENSVSELNRDQSQEVFLEMADEFRELNVTFNELTQTLNSDSNFLQFNSDTKLISDFNAINEVGSEVIDKGFSSLETSQSQELYSKIISLNFDLGVFRSEINKKMIQQKRNVILSYESQQKVAAFLIGVAVLTLLSLFVYIFYTIRNEKRNNEAKALNLQMIDHSNDAIFFTDQNLKITFWNKGAEAMYGYSATEALGYKSYDLLKSPLNKAERKKLLSESLKEKGFKGEVCYYDKYGKEIIVMVSKTAFRNQQNAILGYTTVHNDISKLKASENRLRLINMDLNKIVEKETEERMDILDRMSDGVAALNNKLEYVYINDTACKIKGVERDNIIGVHLLNAFPGFDQTETYRFIQLAMKSQHFQSVTEFFPPFNKYIESRIYPGEKGLSIFVTDVSSHIRSLKQEEKIVRQETDYRNLFNQAPEGIFIADSDKKLIDVNPKACELTGFQKNELIGKHVEDLFFTEDLIDHPILYDELIAGNTIVRQRRFACKGGFERFIEISTRYYPDGKYVGFARDISERKQMLDKIIQSENRYKSIVNNEPECVKVLSRDNLLIDMNPKGLEMIEAVSFEEVKGANVLDLVAPEHKVAFANLTEQVYNGQSGTLEFDIIGLKGSRKTMSTHATPLFDINGAVSSYLAITRDVTNERLFQQQIATLAERNEKTLQTMLDGFILVDAQGQIIDVNPAYSKMIGYSRKELLQMNINELEGSLSQQEMDQRIAQIVKDRAMSFETSHIRKDSNKIDLQVNISVMEVNEQPLISAFVRDITESKKAQRQLKDAFQKVRNLSAHLQNARENERKNLARDLHDEVGQQITSMMMDLSYIKNNIPYDEKLVAKVEELQEMATRFMKSTRKILDNLRPGVLHEMGLSSAIEKLSSDNEERSGIKFTYHDALAGKKLNEDVAVNMYRIVQEAMNNIIKHSKATEVLCSTSLKNNLLTLEIRDNGIGLSNQKTSDDSGYGLIGIQERVNSVGGKFKIEGSSGNGTSLRISVPLSA